MTVFATQIPKYQSQIFLKNNEPLFKEKKSNLHIYFLFLGNQNDYTQLLFHNSKFLAQRLQNDTKKLHTTNSGENHNDNHTAFTKNQRNSSQNHVNLPRNLQTDHTIR